MSDQHIKNNTALRMFFTEPVFLTKDGATPSENQPITTDIPAQTEPIPAKTTDIPEKKFNYTGRNNRNILILSYDSENKISNAAGAELLQNILKYLQLTEEDYALLNYAKHPDTSFETLQGFFKSKIVLSFGVNAAQLRLHPESPEIKGAQGATKLILTAGLHEMAVDKNIKKLFLNELNTIEKW